MTLRQGNEWRCGCGRSGEIRSGGREVRSKYDIRRYGGRGALRGQRGGSGLVTVRSEMRPSRIVSETRARFCNALRGGEGELRALRKWNRGEILRGRSERERLAGDRRPRSGRCRGSAENGSGGIRKVLFGWGLLFRVRDRRPRERRGRRFRCDSVCFDNGENPRVRKMSRK